MKHYEYGVRHTIELAGKQFESTMACENEKQADAIILIFKNDERVVSVGKVKRPVGDWEEA